MFPFVYILLLFIYLSCVVVYISQLFTLCCCCLFDSCFDGYNATVLAYGQVHFMFSNSILLHGHFPPWVAPKTGGGNRERPWNKTLCRVVQYYVSLIPRPVCGPGNETKFFVCICSCVLKFGTYIAISEH